MTAPALSVLQRTEIVFVESNVAEYTRLIAGLDPALEVHVLDATGDGIAQMADILAERSGIDAIHLISHGSAGAVQLGTHRFYALRAGKPDVLTETSRFVDVWKLEDGAWKLSRVISYGHELDPAAVAAD